MAGPIKYIVNIVVDQSSAAFSCRLSSCSLLYIGWYDAVPRPVEYQLITDYVSPSHGFLLGTFTSGYFSTGVRHLWPLFLIVLDALIVARLFGILQLRIAVCLGSYG